MPAVQSVLLPCWARSGEWLGELQIADSRGEASLLSNKSGAEISISESGSYALLLRRASKAVACFSPPVIAGRVGGADELFGTLASHVGLGALQLGLDTGAGEPIWRQMVRIRPAKFRAVAEFETMVAEICAWRTALAFDMRAHSSAPWSLDERSPEVSPEEELIVLRAAVEGEGLFEGLAHISRNAQSRLDRDDTPVRLGEGAIDPHRYGAHLARGGLRFAVPATHSLRPIAASLPVDMPTMRRIDTIDTPPNRFAKHVAVSVRHRVVLAMRAGIANDTPIGRWASSAAAHLDRITGSEPFSRVSALTRIDLGDPTLQRRQGYRAVLRAYLAARAGLAIAWPAMSELVYAETRDVPSLYELWCLIRVRRALEEEFDVQLSMDHFIVGETGIRVRRGSAATADRPLTIGSRSYGIRLWYNRSFLPSSTSVEGPFRVHEAAPGTWSKAMKPDFTIELLPLGHDSTEPFGTRRFLHLDAKYRLKSLLAAPDDAERSHKPDDIDKMHAYLSSIADSAGAHVLYPGDATVFFSRRHSLDAVGALATAPGRMEDFASRLRELIEATFAG